jgi:hypothetical protein
MIQTEGNHEMDTNWAQGTLTVALRGLTGDLVDFYHMWLASTKFPDGKGGSVYREDRYSVTE